MRILRLGREDSTEAEITQLHIVVLVKEQVARLEVSMQDDWVVVLLGVAFVEGQEHLHEDLPDHLSCPVDLLGNSQIFPAKRIQKLDPVPPYDLLYRLRLCTTHHGVPIIQSENKEILLLHELQYGQVHHLSVVWPRVLWHG